MMGRWLTGQSGNPKGRPRNEIAIAALARSQVKKHKLVERLGRIGARAGEYSKVDFDQQIRAIRLLLAYGYGPPRGEIEGNEGVVIQVNYVERNSIAINCATSRAVEDHSASETVQRGLLRPPVGQDDARNGPVDSPGVAG
jgi:hypothetical protein